MNFLKVMLAALALGAAVVLRWLLLAVFYSSATMGFLAMFALVVLEKGMDRLADLIVRIQR